MASPSAKQLREQTKEELVLRLAEAKKELFNLRVRMTTKELTNPSDIRFKRREIARLLTLIGEKQSGSQA